MVFSALWSNQLIVNNIKKGEKHTFGINSNSIRSFFIFYPHRFLMKNIIPKQFQVMKPLEIELKYK